MIRRLLNAMYEHDANEERRYLREGQPSIAWSWCYLAWEFGFGGCWDQGSEAGVWVSFGPVSIEIFWSLRR